MSRTQYATATSLNGFIADERNSLEWLFSVPGDGDDEGHAARFARFMRDVGAMAMGSTTYEWVLEHEGLLDHPERWQQYYEDRPCWVFSHRQLPAIPGTDLRFTRGDVRSVHAAMVEAAGGRNVWLVGGGDLVGQFADEGLLDEILVNIAPVTLRAGAPLLPRTLLASDLTLVDVERHGQFVDATYRVARTPTQADPA